MKVEYSGSKLLQDEARTTDVVISCANAHRGAYPSSFGNDRAAIRIGGVVVVIRRIFS